MSGFEKNIWRIATILFFLFAIIEAILLIIAGAGFNSLKDFISEGHINCAEYCDSREQPLYLFDFIMQACQCYSEAEKPTDYKNLATGVEIKYKEKDCIYEIATNYGVNDCVFEGCEAGDVLIARNIE